MPSTSKKQQRLFGWALACKTGKTDNCPVKVKKLADTMSNEELEKYASTSHEGLPENVENALYDFISEITEDELTVLENDSDLFETVKDTKQKSLDLKPSDVPVTKDVKTPPPVVETPDAPPGYIHADKRKAPGFFTPSLFKRPGDKEAKRERRTMDFNEFLKRINYRTHDSILQRGHGQNLTGKGPY